MIFNKKKQLMMSEWSYSYEYTPKTLREEENINKLLAAIII